MPTSPGSRRADRHGDVADFAEAGGCSSSGWPRNAAGAAARAGRRLRPRVEHSADGDDDHESWLSVATSSRCSRRTSTARPGRATAPRSMPIFAPVRRAASAWQGSGSFATPSPRAARACAPVRRRTCGGAARQRRAVRRRSPPGRACSRGSSGCRCRWSRRWCSPSPASSSTGLAAESKRWHAARRRSRQVLRVRARRRRSSPTPSARPRMGRRRAAGRSRFRRASRVEQLELLGIAAASRQRADGALMYKWRGQPLSVYVLNSEHPRVGVSRDWSSGSARRRSSGRRAAAPTRSSRAAACRRSSSRPLRAEGRAESGTGSWYRNNMMTTRWMIAAAGAIGVGVLTASALLGPTTHVRVRWADPD